MFEIRLAELRKQKKISQYALARLTNLSRGQIANYEQGIRQPDFKTLVILADFFEISLDYLLGRTDIKYEAIQTFNTVLFGGLKEELTEEEAEYLKESISTLRKYKTKVKDK